ncbi:MAG: hypothetical protein E3K32_09190 [wastewater metagenome]|nr:hypothetical protein [Candidatus Loosdrechtia aerotolerans]
MRILCSKYMTIGTLLGISAFFSISFIGKGPVYAQHIDIFGKLGEQKDSYHQSFAPYGGTVPIPWIDDKPTPTTIKVTEITTYEIPVDEKKLGEKKLTIDDLKLKEVTNASEINFHQVDCYFFHVVKQTQVRNVENLSFKRERDGTQYWLSDGKKYVEWGRWSDWVSEKESQKTLENSGLEMAEKKP